MQQFVHRVARSFVLSTVLGMSAFVGAMTANALTVLSASEVLDNVAPANGVTGTSIDRVLSDGIASQWGFAKSYPGTTQVSPPPFPSSFPPPFDAYVISFAPNANQQVFYEIKWMTSGFSPTSAAYLDAFDPMNVATNYLGDIGGASLDTLLTYRVIVPAGHSLAVAFLDDVQNSLGSFTSYTFSIDAFSDANRGENFGVVPLPSAIPLFATGLGALGLFGWRRKRKQAA
jgi:hypothetical protein